MKTKATRNEKLKVLCLEDDPRDAEIMRELLTNEGFDLKVDCTEAEKEFVSFLRGNTYDVILSDFKLPGFDGFTALRYAKEICPQVPFICVSGTIGEEAAVELLKQGAVDYVLKDNLKRLPAAIKRALDEAKEKELRRQAEEALQESETRYRSILQSATDAIITVDSSGIIIGWNSAAERIFGYSYTEAVGQPLTSIILFYPLDEHTNRMMEFQTEGDQNVLGKTGVYKGFRKDKSEFPIELSLSSWETKSGQFFTCIVRDITERKRAEEELKKSEEKYRSIFENVQDVYYETALDGTILEVSPSIEIMSKGQYHRDDLIGKSMYDFYSVAGGRQTLIALLQERGSVSDYEIMLKNRDGSQVPCSISTKIQLDVQGTPLKVIGSMRDITERKSLQSQILQTQKVQSIGTLAGGIAHDFNNILGIILAYTSVLERSEGDKEKVSKSTTAITQAVGRGAALVRQILTFARQTGVVVKPMFIPDLIHEIINMLKETFPEVIEFRTTMENNVPFINADHSQMHQVLLNLCVNARDAMPTGGIIGIDVKTVTSKTIVQQFPDAKNARYIFISVSDTGIGMDEATRSRIFDPFFTTKEQGKGTGLGLSVVHGVIQDHHGFISVESTVGQGTTFRLYIPVPQEEKRTQEIKNTKVEELQRGSETILFVEDEELLREIVQSTLESNGYKVLLATNGREAVEIYKKQYKDIALVLSDMGLPKLAGIDVYAMLKEINPNVKIIFASGFISLETRSELFKEGAKGFIQKPYNVYEVLQMVREVLNENGGKI
jgi:PAS domain S-box-containing protein